MDAPATPPVGGPPPSPRRRRRTSSPTPRKRSLGTTLAGYLRDRRMMDAVMAMAALIFLGSGYWRFKNDLVLYADMFVGSSQPDLVYLFGQPTTRTGDATAGEWTFAQDGRTLTARFDEGRLSRVECTVTAAIGTCPPMLGIGSGMTEERARLLLGTPDRQTFRGDDKLLGYDSIGVELGLTRFQVFSIAISDHRTGLLAYWARFVRAMLP